MTFLLLTVPQLEQNEIFSKTIFSLILLVLFTAVLVNAISKTFRFPLDHEITALPRTATALSIIPAVTIELNARRLVPILIIFSII